ncbi:MAG: hypothetical protein ABEL51_10005 [Salinibacter sp.]
MPLTTPSLPDDDDGEERTATGARPDIEDVGDCPPTYPPSPPVSKDKDEKT